MVNTVSGCSCAGGCSGASGSVCVVVSVMVAPV